MNRAYSEYSLLKTWIVTRHDDLDMIFLKIDYLIEEQITETKTILEYSRLKEKENDKSNLVIVSCVTMLCSCVELPKISYILLSREIQKIAHIRMKKSSEFGLGLGSGSGSGAFYNFVYPCIVDWKNVVGDGNCGFMVLSYFLHDDGNQWHKVRRHMWNEMHYKWNLYWNFFGGSQRFDKIWDGFAPRYCWMDVPNHLIIVANKFNLCIILLAKQDSCTILPFYLASDHVGDTIVIGHLVDSEYFIA
ncbi:hypothetical protein M9H77_11927 [Catharanthus roseus]|uniref:Uncharacterized protein n=1 Tax=Catharanthus roseus TaxID=4058 RepID=A0ACC0BG43_CATRO|nr:hypothetical protein M9H77_11927 [Catharanthus roseus]